MYRDGERVSRGLEISGSLTEARDADGFVWIDILDPSGNEFHTISQEFPLHELAVEDAIKAHQRPKLEKYSDTLFMVLKPARFVAESGSIEIGEIQVFVGAHFVISVRHGDICNIAPVQINLESRPDLLRHGPEAIVYGVADYIIDGFKPVVREIDDKLRDIESQVFSDSNERPTQQIYQLQSEVIKFDRAVSPVADMFDDMGDYAPLIGQSLSQYFADVHDHALRVDQQLDGSHELLTSVLQANFTEVSIRQNEDMRKISAWVAIIAVPTLIAGIYGMNFKHMPELESIYGYPVVIGAILIICGYLYRRFHHDNWL